MAIRKIYRRNGASYPKKLILHEEEIFLQRSVDVLIKVHAVSLNYRDINILRGTNPWPVKEDGVPVSDAAGEIVELGSDVDDLKVGDRVMPIFDQKNLTGDEQARECTAATVQPQYGAT